MSFNRIFNRTLANNFRKVRAIYQHSIIGCDPQSRYYFLKNIKNTEDDKSYQSPYFKCLLTLPIIAFISLNFAECESDQEKSSFFEGAKKNSFKELKNLIKSKKVNVNQRHRLGWTALHTAIINKNFQSVKILLENGADPNLPDEFVNINVTAKKLGMNPLQVLFEREEDFSNKLNSRATFKGFTPLHYAVLTDSLELVKLLLDAGADSLLENEMGHKACEYSDNEDIKKILEEGEKKSIEKKEARLREERRKFPLEDRIKKKIIGQEAAVQVVSSVIRRKENGWIDEEVKLF